MEQAIKSRILLIKTNGYFSLNHEFYLENLKIPITTEEYERIFKEQPVPHIINAETAEQASPVDKEILKEDASQSKVKAEDEPMSLEIAKTTTVSFRPAYLKSTSSQSEKAENKPMSSLEIAKRTTDFFFQLT